MRQSIRRGPFIILGERFRDFFLFAPLEHMAVFCLLLLQGASASIGVLLLIPLLEIVGVRTGFSLSQGEGGILSEVLGGIGIQLTLGAALGIYVILVGVAAAIRYLSTVQSAKLQQSYISALRKSLYLGLVRSNWEFIVGQRMSDFTHRLSGQVQSVGFVCYLMLSSAGQVVLSLFLVMLSALLSWKLTLVAVAFSCVMSFLMVPINKFVHRSGKVQLDSYKKIFHMLTEHIGALKVIKGFSGEGVFIGLLSKESGLLEEQMVRLARVNAATQFLYLMSAVLVIAGLFYLSQTAIQASVGTTILLVVIIARLLPQVSGLMRNAQQLLHQVPALVDVAELQQLCHQSAEPSMRDLEVPALAMARELRLSNVSYQYPGTDAPVIKDLSLVLPANRTIAITGTSGAGKTTLADLLAGLLVPTGGRIFCDGTPLEGAARVAWRASVAYVTQEAFLFHDSVRANLAWVLPGDVTDAQLWDALRLASAEDFVRCLPQGLDTIIGDRGVRLSGGERQRLAIARGLLTHPRFLIFDEATSALDSDCEAEVLSALRRLRGKLTVLLISHRPSTLAEAEIRVALK